MWNYAAKVRDYFFHPRDAGALDGSLPRGEAARLILTAACQDIAGPLGACLDDEEDAPVCKCRYVDEDTVERAIRVHRLTTLEQVTEVTKASGSCGTCAEAVEAVLARTHAAMVAEGVLDAALAFDPRRRAPPPFRKTEGAGARLLVPGHV